MNGIEKMTALILSEAEAERDAKLEKAKGEADTLLESYRAKAEALKAAEAEKTAKEVAALLERASASNHQAERNRLLEAKGVMLDRAYEGALTALCSDERAAKPEYLALLKTIFDSALAGQLETEKRAAENDTEGDYQPIECYTLRLNSRDSAAIGAKLLDYAQKTAAKAGKTVSLDERTADIRGGFILVCGDIELGCSLEQYMNGIRGETEGEVCAILFA